MGLQRLPGSFRTAPGTGTNVLDQVLFSGGPAYEAARSPGATLIDNANALAIGKQWKLLSVSVQAYLTFQVVQSCYGLLGKIIAGVDTSGQLSITNNGTSPYTPTFLPLPSDATLTQTLWTPDSDPIPPAPGITPGLAVYSIVTLPVPITVFAGLQILVGLWMLPSLIGTPVAGVLGAVNNLLVQNGTYLLNFDDGS